MQCNLDQSHPKIWIDILSNQTLNAYYTTPSSRVALSAWRLHCIRALFSLENDDTHARKPMSSSSGLRSSERAGGLSLSRGYCIILVLGHGAFSIGWCFKHSSEGKKAVRSPDKLYIWNLLYPHCLRLHHHTRRTDIIIIIIPSLKDDEDYSFFREINLLMRLVFCWISSRQPRKSFNLHYEFSSHLYFVVSLLTYLYTVFLFSCLTRQTEDG